MDFNHVNIKAPMRLLEKEREFFCEVLNLKEGFRPEFNNRGFWLYAGDKAIVHLTEAAGEDANHRINQGYIDHLAFQSSGARDFVTTLNKLKIAYTTCYINEINTQQVFFRSPLDIRIEVAFTGEKI